MPKICNYILKLPKICCFSQEKSQNSPKYSVKKSHFFPWDFWFFPMGFGISKFRKIPGNPRVGNPRAEPLNVIKSKRAMKVRNWANFALARGAHRGTIFAAEHQLVFTLCLAVPDIFNEILMRCKRRVHHQKMQKAPHFQYIFLTKTSSFSENVKASSCWKFRFFIQKQRWQKHSFWVEKL